MLRHRSKAPGVVVAGLLILAGCTEDSAIPSDQTAAPAAGQQPLGLMTSLPLYWPAGAQIADLAAGCATVPWQRRAIEARYAITPLDTLSPVAALLPGAAAVDPLSGITRLAVIQPRGLSPADNVALDGWVRAGGRLLLVLDPALTGDYDIALGNPRRPVDNALIPAVAARWGLAVSFDEAQEPAVGSANLAGTQLPLALPGRIAVTDPAVSGCTLQANGAAAMCRVGKGRVTLLADAAVFEHPELAGDDGWRLLAVLAAALE